MTGPDAPWHAHIYFTGDQQAVAEALRANFAEQSHVLFVGTPTTGPAGPHPIPQYEIHFLKRDVNTVVAAIEATGLRALVHPLTDDDLADHTSLAHWIGAPVMLDVTTLDPPGENKGIPRFGLRDF